MAKPLVYLAGPMSGCNLDQLHAWRNDLKHGFADEFCFTDPTDNIIERELSDFAVVQADADAIQAADAVLANMWKESIGTAMGVVHAHTAGKIVVVCDPNFIRSRTLAFYADSVERTLPEALAAIRTLLASETRLPAVSKTGGELEPFDRKKLALSVRKACIAANQSDLVPARAIVTKALSLLLAGEQNEEPLTTVRIKDAVWEALAELGSDPMHQADYEAIRTGWEEHELRKRGATKASPQIGFRPMILDRPLEVSVRAGGTHSTIWGHFNNISPGARQIFDDMCCVEGITQIVMRQFTNTSSPPAKPHVRLQASKTPAIIEGKCYDRGKKGTLQTFQVFVANSAHRDAILGALREHMAKLGHIRSVVFSAD